MAEDEETASDTVMHIKMNFHTAQKQVPKKKKVMACSNQMKNSVTLYITNLGEMLLAE